MTSGAVTAVVLVSGVSVATGDRFMTSIPSGADHRQVPPGKALVTLRPTRGAAAVSRPKPGPEIQIVGWADGPCAVVVSHIQIECLYGGPCLLYTSDAADDLTRVDLGG